MTEKSKLKVIITVTILIFFNNIALSKNYNCPKLPSKFRIGEITSEQWYIWIEDVNYNFANKLYYKLFKKQKTVRYWGGFPTGWLYKDSSYETNYIGCCVLYKKNKVKLCAYKNVIENNCKPNIRGPGPDGFICTEKKHNES